MDPASPVQKRPQGPASFKPYVFKNLRARNARLCYRRSDSDAWTHLEDSYEFLGAKEDQADPWNVEQLTLSPDGIQVEQCGEYHSRSNREKGGIRREEDWLCWRILFKLESFDQIYINSAPRKYTKLIFNEIRFRLNSAPESSDATQHKTESTESAEAEAGINAAEEDAEPMENGLAPGLPLELTDAHGTEGEKEEADLSLKPDQFPLAKLFEDQASVPGLEIRLTMLKTGTGKNNSYIWNWPAATHFLCVRGDYKVVTKTQRTHEINDMQLDQYLMENKSKLAWASLEEFKRPGSTSEWRLKPKLMPQVQDTKRTVAFTPSTAGPLVPPFSGELPNPQQPTTTVSALAPISQEHLRKRKGEYQEESVEDIQKQIELSEQRKRELNDRVRELNEEVRKQIEEMRKEDERMSDLIGRLRNVSKRSRT